VAVKGHLAAPSPPTSAALLASLLHVAAASAQKVTGADRSAAALPVRGTHGRRAQIVHQGGEPPLPDRVIQLVARLVRVGPLSFPDTNGRQAGLSHAVARAGARGLAAVPLRIGASQGCLLAASDSRRAFSPAEVAGLAGVAQAATLAMGEAEAVLSAERRRLGRVLHDTFGQTLTSLIFAIDALDEDLGSDEKRLLTRPLRAHALKAVREMREVLDSVFRPADGQDRLRGIHDLVQEVSNSGVVVNFRSDLGEAPLTPEVAECVYHVAREALLNVSRHAFARRVTLLLRYARGRVEIIVSDDGRGLQQDEVPTTGWGHFGLAMMREQVEEIGGTFIIQSARGEGTRVIARLPLGGDQTS
jgi:signal transduction histidine kinase